MYKGFEKGVEAIVINGGDLKLEESGVMENSVNEKLNM